MHHDRRFMKKHNHCPNYLKTIYGISPSEKNKYAIFQNIEQCVMCLLAPKLFELYEHD